jgi:GrpB-like predicted nucleotidyltransferase (UPF0157 family)
MKVIVESHDPAWIDEFQRVHKDLQSILEGIPIIAIEHVGSTSIPDLVAKPIIDIAIVTTEENIQTASDALVKAGYTAIGIMGIPGRWAFRQPGYQAGDQLNRSWVEGGEMRRNTYVTIDGCISIRNQMDLKKTLLADEVLRHEYGDVKRRLIESRVKDVDEYCVGKTEVILKILRRAGWNKEDLEVVREANL